MAAIVFVLLIGVWAVISGGLLVYAAFSLKLDHGRWWLALAGVASLIFGILLFIAPVIGAVVLTWWIGRKLFSPAAGVVAGLGAAVYGPMVFYTGTPHVATNSDGGGADLTPAVLDPTAHPIISLAEIRSANSVAMTAGMTRKAKTRSKPPWKSRGRNLLRRCVP